MDARLRPPPSDFWPAASGIRTRGVTPVPSEGPQDRREPHACPEHAWTDTVLTFTDDGAWVEQRCRLCEQIGLLGPDDSSALPTWFNTLRLRGQRLRTEDA